MDTTELRIRAILRQGVEEAYGIVDPRRRDDSDHPDAEPCLDCEHELGSHHGDDGECRCGERGCGCRAGRYASRSHYSRSHYSSDDDLVGTPDHNRRV